MSVVNSQLGHNSRETSAALRARVTALRPQWDAHGISGFVYLEGGYSNANYRFEYGGERYVLRAPGTAPSFADRALEQRLYAGGCECMPEVIAFDARSGCMISRWVPGTLLADLRPGPEALVRYLRDLHDAIPDPGRVYDPLAQARANLDHASAPAWLERMAARAVWAPQRVTPCHNDLNPWNIIRTPDDRWVTLDWEWTGRNDPLFDLVTLHQGANLSLETLTEMAERYTGEPVAAGRLRGCLVAFWLRETSWALAELAAGNDRPEIREQARLGAGRLKSLS